MKRGIKYGLLIGLVIASMVFKESIDLEEIQKKGWLVDSLVTAAISVPYMLLFYTAGYDPKLKGWISVYAKILFWSFVALYVVGRIMPYVNWLQ